MRTAMPSDRLVQLVLGDAPGRQAVVPMRTPMPPEKMSIRRRDSRVSPDTAIAVVELHDSEVRVCRSGSREAERQHTNCESESLHSTPRVAPSAASPVFSRRLQKAGVAKRKICASDAHMAGACASSSSADPYRGYSHPEWHGVV